MPGSGTSEERVTPEPVGASLSTTPGPDTARGCRLVFISVGPTAKKKENDVPATIKAAGLSGLHRISYMQWTLSRLRRCTHDGIRGAVRRGLQ